MKPLVTGFLFSASVWLSGCSAAPVAPAVPGSQMVFALAPSTVTPAHRTASLCPREPVGVFRCFATVNELSAGVHGYGPQELQNAYRFPSSERGRGSVIAVVDAFDDPKAESDMHVYRSHYRLRECTTKNGCFEKVNEQGARGRYPHVDSGWAGEISLDLDMVSAICPNCKILLVEASSNTAGDLGFAVRTAAKLGAHVISNSYGGFEYAPYDASFDRRNEAVVVAGTGDDGYTPQQPASFSSVIAVGGTSLRRAPNARGWSETVWSDAGIGATGSGCSEFVKKPAWQSDRGCPTRAAADVSAVADPLTGVAVYDSVSLGLGRPGGWKVMGGTSVATPIIASAYALAGNARQLSRSFAKSIYGAAGTLALNDVVHGSNGNCPAVYSYVCKAQSGYDGPSGFGTPNGVSAF